MLKWRWEGILIFTAISAAEDQVRADAHDPFISSLGFTDWVDSYNSHGNKSLKII